jgi:alkylresorcinol/alkylpyrone synthase
MQIAATGRAFPPNYYDQESLLAALSELWADRFHNPARLRSLHENVLVGGRYLSQPLESYRQRQSFTDTNDAFIHVATDLAEAATRQALSRAGLEPRDVDAIFFTTVTGVAAPSIDARLVNRLGLRPDVRRTPLFGLGCVAGAAGIARAADYVKAWPDSVALLVSVELCSLTLQREDFSIPNLIATGLFGDGAAAVLIAGADRTRMLRARPGHPGDGPRVLASRSVFYPDTEDVMGWRIGAEGFRLVLSGDVPLLAERHLRGDVDHFLGACGLGLAEIRSFVCHPGGPKVLRAIEAALELAPEALELTWKSLAAVGNVSSSSVLLVLDDTIHSRRPAAGDYGMMLAMGPGFCSELVLLQW